MSRSPTRTLVLPLSVDQHASVSSALRAGGVVAGRAEGDPVLSEGEAAHHRSGGEHERLCVPQMQGH